MQLKRKTVTSIAVGVDFMVALGKDVSESALRKKKALKAKKQREAKNRHQAVKNELYKSNEPEIRVTDNCSQGSLGSNGSRLRQHERRLQADHTLPLRANSHDATLRTRQRAHETTPQIKKSFNGTGT